MGVCLTEYPWEAREGIFLGLSGLGRVFAHIDAASPRKGKGEHMKKKKCYPCKDCDKRQVGCHSYCERYLDVKREKEEEKKSRIKDIKVNDAVGELRYSRMKSLKHGRR